MATTYDISIDQGSTHKTLFFINELTNPELPYHVTNNPWIPMNLTDATARMQIRKTVDSKTSLLDLVSPSQIIINPAGSLSINILDTESSSIKITGDSLDCVYDLELIVGSSILRVVQGACTISKEITTLI